MIRRRPKRSALGISLILAFAGCDTRTTSVVVADPSRVTVSTNGVAVLPAADGVATEQRGLVRDDSFEPEPGARAHYKVEAVRQKGEIALEWSTQVPILNGEHQTLVDARGHFNDPDAVIAIMSPDVLNAPNFQVIGCAHLDGQSAKGASLIGYRATEWSGCGAYSPRSSSPDARFTIETPWSNVVEIRDHTDVSVPGDIAIGVFGLGMTGGGVALIAVPKSCVGCVIGGAFLGLIGALTTVTVALDIAGGPRDGITYPPKKPAP
jgi:hypothetical protein